MVFQDLALWPNLSVMDRMSAGDSLGGLEKKGGEDTSV